MDVDEDGLAGNRGAPMSALPVNNMPVRGTAPLGQVDFVPADVESPVARDQKHL